jgi:DNA-binding transcriptional LysR family regulator
MELRQLRYFLAIVEHGSFSRAASELGRTQQALSKAIQALEDELGVRLLDRDAQHASPTAFGKLLLEHSRAIECELRSLRAKLSDLLEAESGIVRLGSGPSAAGGLVARALLDLQRSRPQVHVDVLGGLHGELVQHLQQGRIDLAVCIETRHMDHANLVRETLGEDEYVIVCGAGHPLAGEREVSVADLAGMRWIAGHNLGEVDSEWAALFDEAGVARPKAAIETDSIEFCRTAISTEEYLSVLTRSLIEDELRSGQLRTVAVAKAAWRRPVVLLYRRGGLQVPAMLAVMNALHAAAQVSAAAE